MAALDLSGRGAQGRGMDVVDIFLAQLADPFRIGLVVMLLITAARTEASVGMIVPLALGTVFVAILIPVTFGEGDMAGQIAVGLATNAIILAAAIAIRLVFAGVPRPKA
jgi:hypothetical protein